MNVTNPTISVVIPLYNKEKTVQRALDSIMKQTVLPQEIIVVDDGSTDGSRAVVEQEHNPLVMLFYQENSGVSAARNRGIREAQGAWIAFLDADDEWDPGYLEQIDRLIRQFPSCIGAATAYFLGNEQGSKRRMTLRKLPFTTESGVLSNYFQVAVHSDPPVWTSAVCVQKTKFLEIGGFPNGLKSGEDLLTWARLATIGNFSYCAKPFSIYWQENQTISNLYQIRIPDSTDIVGKQLMIIYRSETGRKKKWVIKYIGHWHKMRASAFLRLGMDKLALKEIFLALRYHSIYPIKLFLYFLMIFIPLKLRMYLFKYYNSIH